MFTSIEVKVLAMGLFDLFFGGGSASTVQALDDRIWLTEEAKFNVLAKQLN